MFWNNKKLSHQDLVEFQALVRLVSQEKYKYLQIKGNTYQIPKGQALAGQQFALLTVLEQSVKEWIGALLSRYGCKKGFQYHIDGETGKIKLVQSTNEDIPEDIRKQLAKEK